MSERQFATFFLDDLMLGIDILAVREINRHLEMTSVPDVKEHVCGLLNLRGQIITMLDLGVSLDMGRRRITPESRGVILKTQEEIAAQGLDEKLAEAMGNDCVGLLVDRVGDVISVDDEAIEPPPANIGRLSGKHLSGVAQLEDDLLSILKIDSIDMES